MRYIKTFFAAIALRILFEIYPLIPYTTYQWCYDRLVPHLKGPEMVLTEDGWVVKEG